MILNVSRARLRARLTSRLIRALFALALLVMASAYGALL